MLFKLSVKNMTKSFKDYAIYFLTLIFGVSIFYMFNSLDSQQAMLQVSSSTSRIIGLMIDMLSFVSIFVAVVLGLLIVYANNFLINRRKKEFGIYMTLGMGRRQISKIILFETVLVGIISLIVGLVIGIFASQFMSILVGKMFEADMTNFQFVFSGKACIKTCLYFAIMYIAVMIFNVFTISRYRLINLLTAIKKNEKVKIKNPIVCILIFLAACVMLGRAYFIVTSGINAIDSEAKLLVPIAMGTIATILIFWSLAGLLLRIIQVRKGIYLKDINMFVLRQLNNKINTNVISVSVICLLLFMTISILSSCLSLKSSMTKELEEVTPVDLNLFKSAYLPESYTSKSGKLITYTKDQIEDSRELVSYTLKNNGFDMSNLKDVVEVPVYTDNNLNWRVFFEGKVEYLALNYDTVETIMKISDYNKVAELYKKPQYELNEDEFIVLCEFTSMKETRDNMLKDGKTLKIADKEYKSKYLECKEGFINMATTHTNMGIILVPDDCNLSNEQIEKYYLMANYNANKEEDKQRIEEMLSDSNSELLIKLRNNKIKVDGVTKSSLRESSIGLATIIVFIAIYLGIIFLIASVVILALKQLTESADNKQRYVILRKIGCDERMVNSALFKQIGIFFLLPLILAIVHSVFGIQFICIIFDTFTSSSELLPSIIGTAIIIGIIYGLYFLATYLGSKNIIKEED